MYYTNLGAMTVVVSTPLTYQTTISLPIGGCSQLYDVTLPMAPPTSLSVTVSFAKSNATGTPTANPGFTVVNPDNYSSGDLTRQFKICAGKSVLPDFAYTFAVAVGGADKADYIAANPSISVTVFKTKGNVSAPSSVRVPKGGCANATATITMSTLPDSSLSVSLSKATLLTAKLYTNLSDSQAFFSSSGVLTQYFSVCSNESAVTNSTGAIPLLLEGANSADFLLATDSIIFTIDPPPVPQVAVSAPKTYVGGQAVFNFTSNLEGRYYCSVREGVFANDTNPIDFYKQLVASNQSSVQSSADRLSRLYVEARDWTVVSTKLLPGVASSVPVQKKVPNTNYTYCCYYENTAGNFSTSPACSIYLTPSDPAWLRYSATFKFSSVPTKSQRNKLLGYFRSNVGGVAADTVDSQGESYNEKFSAPDRQWYVYKGATDVKLTEIVFLTVRDAGDGSQTLVQNFHSLFQDNGSLTSVAATYLNNTVDGLLVSGRYNGSTDYISTKRGNRTAVVDSPMYNQNGSYINVTNVTMDSPGSVFFGVGLLNSKVPSQEQLLNCQDGANATLLSCSRLVVNEGNTVTYL